MLPASRASAQGSLFFDAGWFTVAAALVLVLTVSAVACRAKPRAPSRFWRRQLMEVSSVELGHLESFKCETSDGSITSLHAQLQKILAALMVPPMVPPPGEAETETPLASAAQPMTTSSSRFECEVTALVLGSNIASVLPIAEFMGVEERSIARAVAAADDGIGAMRDEFKAHGTPDDLECLHYVLEGKTGDSTRVWPNGVLDSGRPAGQTLSDFASHPHACTARLSMAMVLALRLYTTAAYRSINNPLRDLDADFQPRGPLGADNPHPLPVTVHLLSEAIRRLRAVEGEARGQAGQKERVVLWRGLRHLRVADDFQGGSERAPMSTTTSLAVAVRYSASRCSVLLQLITDSFRDRGANLRWISAFPGEDEVLYPPLTYLAPTGRRQVVEGEGAAKGVSFTIIEVHPSFG